MPIRLQKILADAGVASRRKSEEMIAAGRVSVNGQTAALGAKAVPGSDVITVDGKPLSPAHEKIYIMLHKPEGVVTTLHDPQGRAAVLDLLAGQGITARVYPVGRLDYDSSGLLLLTNDGALTQKLAHPRGGVKKIYSVRVKGNPSPEALRSFGKGFFIDGRLTAPCKVSKIKHTENDSLLRVTLSEGRNRQVRKMCEAMGHPVLSLKRVAVGPLKLGGLPRGKWRYLTQEEIGRLLNE